MQDETLFPNESACKRFRELAHAFAERAAKLYNSGPELAYINKKIGKWMPEDSPVVKVDSHPRLSGVMDSVNATLAHGPNTRLPNEFYDKKVRADIDKVCTEEWFAGYSKQTDGQKGRLDHVENTWCLTQPDKASLLLRHADPSAHYFKWYNDVAQAF